MTCNELVSKLTSKWWPQKNELCTCRTSHIQDITGSRPLITQKSAIRESACLTSWPKTQVLLNCRSHLVWTRASAEITETWKVFRSGQLPIQLIHLGWKCHTSANMITGSQRIIKYNVGHESPHHWSEVHRGMNQTTSCTRKSMQAPNGLENALRVSNQSCRGMNGF